MFLFTNFQCNLKGTQLVVTPNFRILEQRICLLLFFVGSLDYIYWLIIFEGSDSIVGFKNTFYLHNDFFLKRLFTIVATGSKLGYFLYLFTVRTSLRCPASANYLNPHH